MNIVLNMNKDKIKKAVSMFLFHKSKGVTFSVRTGKADNNF